MESERIKQILQQLVTNPHDEEVMQRLVPLLEQDPKKVLHYAKDVAKQQEGVTHTRLTDLQSEIRWGTKPTTWANCIGEQVCTPIEQREPKSLQDVVDFVNDARAKNQRVRAIGSGHAFSDITRTDNAILVNPLLMHGVLNLNSQTLKEKGKSMKLFRVQSGITVEHLDDELEKAGLALINMGAYDGQTISGALSTGTHGTGATFGPMADFLQSVVLVAESGTVYQIEPTDGITDPAKFSGKLPESDVLVVLKQDDDWFHSVQAAMGCLGVIYSYTLQVTDAFNLSENRTATTWESVKPQLIRSEWNPLPQPLKATDHYELILNPYPNKDGTHSCIKVERMRVGKQPLSGYRHGFWGKFLEYIGVKSSPDLVLILNWFPTLSPWVINLALDTLPDESPPYVDVSHKVFTLGLANEVKALALELHFDARDCVSTIDKVLVNFQELAKTHKWYLAGPIGIRFVAASDAFVAPEAGRLTCTAEFDMLVGIKSGVNLLQEMKNEMCGKDRSIRIHWGLDLDLATEKDVRDWYPDLDKWLAVYKQLNTTGMFNNKFTGRIGIST